MTTTTAIVHSKYNLWSLLARLGRIYVSEKGRERRRRRRRRWERIEHCWMADLSLLCLRKTTETRGLIWSSIKIETVCLSFVLDDDTQENATIYLRPSLTTKTGWLHARSRSLSSRIDSRHLPSRRCGCASRRLWRGELDSGTENDRDSEALLLLLLLLDSLLKRVESSSRCSWEMRVWDLIRTNREEDWLIRTDWKES